MSSRSPSSEPLPEWDWVAERMHATSRREEARRAGLWALSIVRSYLGEDWLRRFYEAKDRVPAFLAYAPSHAVALIQLIEWAARIESTSLFPGAASLRRHLRQELVEHRMLHTALQMEIAALAADVHGGPSFETRLLSQAPVDVVFPHADGTIPVEVFVLTLDEPMRNGFRSDDAISHQMLRIRFTYDVELDGELRAPLAIDDLDSFVAKVESASASVAHSGTTARITDEECDIEIRPAHGASRVRFSGPARHGRGWDRTARRLQGKAEQAIGSGARWLRVDMRDGVWQVSSWSTLPFVDRIDNLAAASAQAVAGLGLDGIVVSSGACHVQGQYIEQSRSGPAGHLGLARRLDAFRARETVILPLTEQGLSDRPAWHHLYDGEATWLDRALQLAGQPSLAAIIDP